MHIGSLRVTLYLAEGSSLKDKRQVIKSLIETTRRKFNVSVAEVDDLDLLRKCTLGIACVSNSASHANSMLDTVLDQTESRPDISVGDVDLEIL